MCNNRGIILTPLLFADRLGTFLQGSTISFCPPKTMAPPPLTTTPASNKLKTQKPDGASGIGVEQQSTRRINDGSGISTPGIPGKAPQFASIPRFSAPGTRHSRTASHPPLSPTPKRLGVVSSTVSTALQRSEVDRVVSAAPEDQDADMLDNHIDPTHVNPKVQFEDEKTIPILPPSPKRARLSSDNNNKQEDYEKIQHPSLQSTPKVSSSLRFIAPSSSTQSPSSQHGQIPSKPRPRPGTQFLNSPFLSSTQPNSPSQPTNPSTGNDNNVSSSSQRPIFLKPTLPPAYSSLSTSTLDNHQHQENPLPEAFSPHRKGQRHVPGGMAAELSSWVIETGQMAAAASRRRDRGGGGGGGGKGHFYGDGFLRKVRVVGTRSGENGSGRLVFVDGVVVDSHEKREDDDDDDGEGEGDEGGERVRVLLMQPDDGRRSRSIKKDEGKVVGRGDVVGIRAPSWDVSVCRGQWGETHKETTLVDEGDEEERDEEEEWIVAYDWRLVSQL